MILIYFIDIFISMMAASYGCIYLGNNSNLNHEHNIVYAGDLPILKNQEDRKSIDTLLIEKINFIDGSLIYNPFLCNQNTCSSLIFSIAREYNIDLSRILTNPHPINANPYYTNKKNTSFNNTSRTNHPTMTDFEYKEKNNITSTFNYPTQNKHNAYHMEDKDNNKGLYFFRKILPNDNHKTKILKDFTVSFNSYLSKFKSYKRIDFENVKITKLEDQLGLNNSGTSFKHTKKKLQNAAAAIELSKNSIRFELKKLLNIKVIEEFLKDKKKLLISMDDQLTHISFGLEVKLKNLGESAAYILAFRAAQSAQLQQVDLAKNMDGSFTFPEEIRIEASEQLQLNRDQPETSDQLKAVLRDIPITLMMRKVSDQGFIAFALGRPSKRLQLKAKSDKLGNIPVNQVFSHKVKGQCELLKQHRAMFNEFSFQSRAELLTDGLPNSMSKRYEHVIEITDGQRIVQLGVKKKDAPPDENIQWKTPKELDVLLKKHPGQYAVYEIHADPRSMKGASESLLQQWKQMRLDSGDSVKPAEGFTHLKNTDWDDSYDNAIDIIKEQHLHREENLKYAENLNLDYAEFILRKEAIDASTSPELINKALYDPAVTELLGGSKTIRKLALQRLKTAGAIAPDIDLLSVGTKPSLYSDNTLQVTVTTGRTNQITRDILDHTGKQAEAIFLRKGIHHGSEDLNLEFPQNLKNDYPIGIVTTDGTATRIPKAESRHPHEHLFAYMRKHPEIDTSINPAYIIKNMSEFPSDLSKWPNAQKKRMKTYDNWIKDGLHQNGKKKAFFQKAKEEMDLFKLYFPLSYRVQYFLSTYNICHHLIA